MCKLSQAMIHALEFFIERVLGSRPLEVAAKIQECWIVFVDGACGGASDKQVRSAASS